MLVATFLISAIPAIPAEHLIRIPLSQFSRTGNRTDVGGIMWQTSLLHPLLDLISPWTTQGPSHYGRRPPDILFLFLFFSFLCMVSTSISPENCTSIGFTLHHAIVRFYTYRFPFSLCFSLFSPPFSFLRIVIPCTLV